MTLIPQNIILASPGGNIVDPMYTTTNEQPSLDQRFATDKSLVDYVSGNNLITFSRASSGTYVDSEGLIKTSVVNLVTYSEEFDNAAWFKSGTSVTPNNVVSPDGTFSADTIEFTSSQGFIAQFTLVRTPGTQVTLSFYAKNIDGNANLNLRGINAGTFYSTPITITNEWARYSATYTHDGTNHIGFVLQDRNASGRGSSAIWGAQLEEGTTATDYIPTTSTISGAPRFDHDPVTGESLGLLVEESRTNFLRYTNNIGNAPNPYWVQNSSGVNVIPNAALSPDGQNNATFVQENSSNTSHYIRHPASHIPSNKTSTVFTYSAYIKPNGRTNITFYNNIGGPLSRFNLDNPSSNVEIFPNGWYRLSSQHTSDPNNPQNTSFFIGMEDSVYTGTVYGAKPYQGNGVSGFYVWGAQCEEGSFPTSYIPTTSSTVTRSPDLASITGANFSSWFNPDASTVYYEGNLIAGASGQYPFFALAQSLAFRVGSIMLSRRSNSGGRFTHYDSNNAIDVDLNSPTWADNSYRKLATAIGQSSAAFADSGSLIGTDTTYQRPSTSDGLVALFIGRGVGGGISAYNVHVTRLTYYPYRLPDATLQEITS